MERKAPPKCALYFLQCVPVSGLGFRRGSYKCVCQPGFYFPDTKAERRYYNGTVIEEEYEKLMMVSAAMIYRVSCTIGGATENIALRAKLFLRALISLRNNVGPGANKTSGQVASAPW